RRSSPGSFSDDESESDAGQSTDRDSGGNGTDHLRGGKREKGDKVAATVAMGRARLPPLPSSSSSSSSSSSPSSGRRQGRGKVTETHSHLGGVAVAENIQWGDSGELNRSGPGGGGKGRDGGGGTGGYVVTVEKCYVIISCHCYHPLMFKDCPRTPPNHGPSPGPGTYPAPSPSLPPASVSPPPSAPSTLMVPPPPSSVGIRKGGRGGGGGAEAHRARATTMTATVEGTDRPQIGHHCMLWNKFLQHVRSNVTHLEEWGKTTIQFPGFLSSPLEFCLVPPSYWAPAMLFTMLPASTVVKAVDVLMLEKTLVVCGGDLGMVVHISKYIHPWQPTLATLRIPPNIKQWEGVFVPVVPDKLLDVLDSPVPALVGVQAPFDPVDYPGVVVLDLDAGSSSVSELCLPWW
ncbi:unnamed protein product, partial [Discosporangium mesarthrocarpum]